MNEQKDTSPAAKAARDQLELIQKRNETEKIKIDVEHERYRNLKLARESAKIPFKLKSVDEKMEGVLEETVKNRIRLPPPLNIICSTVDDVITFSAEEIILIGATSGRGKTTVSSNALHGMWKQGRKALVFSNEETEKGVIDRIAGIELGIPYWKIKKGKCTDEELKLVLETERQIMEFVDVVDSDFRGASHWTTSGDGFMRAWEDLKPYNYDLVVIDYFQGFTKDTQDPSKGEFKVLYELAQFLKKEKNKMNGSILVFSQLKPLSNNEKEFENRIKWCREIFVCATLAVEIVKSEGDYTTDWIVHKDRTDFKDGRRVTTGFHKDKGKYVNETDLDFIRCRTAWMASDAKFKAPDEDEKPTLKKK